MCHHLGERKQLASGDYVRSIIQHTPETCPTPMECLKEQTITEIHEIFGKLCKAESSIKKLESNFSKLKIGKREKTALLMFMASGRKTLIRLLEKLGENNEEIQIMKMVFGLTKLDGSQ